MKRLDIETTGLDSGESAKNDGDLAVDFSVKILKAFEEKTEEHNKQNPDSETTFQQLKRVYIRGATDCYYKNSSKSLNLLGLARVNMYLRYKSGGKISDMIPRESIPSKIEGLTFESQSTKPLLSDFLDVTSGWKPSEEDFTKAEEDIKQYNLDYSFSNIEDIYLEEYEKMQFNWE